MTTVAEEKSYNLRLTKSKEEFITIMKNLNLAYPKQIGKEMPFLVFGLKFQTSKKFKELFFLKKQTDVAVPSNMVCGYQDLVEEIRKAQANKTKSTS